MRILVYYHNETRDLDILDEDFDLVIKFLDMVEKSRLIKQRDIY